jgi:peptidoglycan/LPS O-acetylase OafA/YrhL
VRLPENADYLAFVDGLRAISILAVVAFHVGVPGVSGGFVGVDIFFVISGFLIINQIRGELESDQFSILSFYARRSLRILPPYLIMLMVAYVMAPFFLATPGISLDFVLAATLSPLMVSNILFDLSQGYFDISGIDKPLLHTWTLSVEEQFYLAAPILLALVFRIGNRRFGTLAAVLGIVLGAVSLAGAIVKTHSGGGTNAAFYLAQWRAWEFVAGGLIGGHLVSVAGRLPRVVVDIIGWVGLGGIAVAVAAFDARTPYPSSNAVLPVAGAALVILCGLVQPTAALTRLLSSRVPVGIGLVSYGWYLWHWPILSFMRIARLGESSIVLDGLGAGLLAFVLACISYRYVEQPIRRWRKSPGILERPDRIVRYAAAACMASAVLGGLSALGGYLSTKSYLDSHYGIEGRGVLDNGCRLLTSSIIPDHCLEGKIGIILGDSHADALFGSFARSFDNVGVRLTSLARGGCNPLLFAPSIREHNRTHGCANLIDPFERLLARPTPVAFVIITGAWDYGDENAKLLSELISQFDPARTRVLLIGPVPKFPRSSLDCVALSDRSGGNRERCVRPRADVAAVRAAIVDVLASMPGRFQNVRFLDPIDIFCDELVCRPFEGDAVFFEDERHVLPRGADRIYDAFESDFVWLAGRQ